jgi:alkylation response protein AidB-like acyl-CoA dehydrogenase
MLIARTDWDQPKHRGITFFWLPMKQDGVEVRPLRQATGDARFNEVFITNARVHDNHRLGELNSGWMVLQTALMYERVAMGGGRRGPAMRSTKGATAAAHGSIPMPDTSLISLAKKVGKSNDPNVRQELAKLYCRRMTNEWNAERARAAAEAGSASPLASLGKLNMAEILHYAARIQGHLLGMDATTIGDESSVTYAHNYSQLNAYFFSIGGGTDQIQRNIIGERVLGLPKEPETDREIAFREVPVRG